MKDKYILVGVAVAVIIAFVALLVPPKVSVDMDSIKRFISENVGAISGPDVYSRMFLNAGLTTGGGCFSTTTSGTLLAGTLERNSCLRLTAAGAGQETVSWTLPASTTMSAIIPRVGDCSTWFIDASAVVAATTTTIVAGTGINLVGLDATGAGTGADVLDGNEFGRLMLCRQANTDIVGYVTEWIHAD